MAAKILSRAQAFGPGSQNWFIASKDQSETNNTTINVTTPFVDKMDWYLNFQLTRARLHTPQTHAAQLKSILNENQLGEFDIPSQQKVPLMVLAKEQLPTLVVVDVPINDLRKWPQAIHSVWTKLQSSSLRVFLPPQLTADEFIAMWPNTQECDLTVVPA